jgi:tetratricopeptide (TPR) repeat protein
MLRLGLVDRAIHDMARFAGMAEDQKWPYVRVEAMLLQFRLASRSNAATDLRSMSDRVRAFGQSGAEVQMNPAFKATALLALAESSLLLGQGANAQISAEQALAKLPQSGATSVNTKLAALAHELKGIALFQQGDTEKALISIALAQEGFEKTFGADHPMTQLMALNSALLLEALGRANDARAIVSRAEPILRSALGPAAPTYARVKALRQRLEREVRGVVSSEPTIERGLSSKAALTEFFS